MIIHQLISDDCGFEVSVILGKFFNKIDWHETERHTPVSSRAKPACMNITRAPQRMSHMCVIPICLRKSRTEGGEGFRHCLESLHKCLSPSSILHRMRMKNVPLAVNASSCQKLQHPPSAEDDVLCSSMKSTSPLRLDRQDLTVVAKHSYNRVHDQDQGSSWISGCFVCSSLCIFRVFYAVQIRKTLRNTR